MKKYSDRPKWVGVYYRMGKDERPTFYVVVKNKWYRVGSDAEGARMERLRLLQAGTTMEVEPVTVGQAWNEYLNKMEINSYRSLSTEKSRYIKHIEPVLGKHRLTDISVKDIILLQGQLNAKGLQPSTVYAVLSCLKRVFSFSKKCGYVTNNPVADCEFKNVQKQRNRMLLMEQVDDFLQRCKRLDTKLYQMCACALYAGLRLNEVYQLCRDRVNLYSREMRIRTKHRTRQYKERKVVILDELMPILKELVQLDNEPFFTGKFNYRLFHQIVDSMGLNDGKTHKNREDWFTFHSLRHTFGSMLAAIGIPAMVIKEMMGHESLKSTEIYTHVSDNQMHEAGAQLSAAMQQRKHDVQKSKLRRVS